MFVGDCVAYPGCCTSIDLRRGFGTKFYQDLIDLSVHNTYCTIVVVSQNSHSLGKENTDPEQQQQRRKISAQQQKKTNNGTTNTGGAAKVCMT